MQAMVEPQLPLPMPRAPEQRLETFIDPPPGLLAWLRDFAEPGSELINGYLQGAPGSGKTHLLLATCAHVRDAGGRARYLPLARFAPRLAELLQATDADGLLAVDDVDLVAGDAAAEQALFDLHNRARQRGARLLYAARRAPALLPLGLPDLRSRLAQCSRVLLSPLDDAGRATLLQQRAQQRGLVLEPAAIQWLLRRQGRDLAGLTALLERLDVASLAAQRRITVPFLRELLKQ